MFVTCHIGEDYIEKEIEQQNTARNNYSDINQTSNTDAPGTSLLQTGIGPAPIKKIQRNVEELADNHTKWDSKRVAAD